MNLWLSDYLRSRDTGAGMSTQRFKSRKALEDESGRA